MAYYDSLANTIVFEAVVTGTHSSGKSTLIDSFGNPELSASYDIPEPFGFDLIDLDQDDDAPTDDRRIPVLTIGEAATAYAQEQGNPALLGDEYNFATQQAIEMQGVFNLGKAKLVLAMAIDKARRDFGHDSIANVAFTLSDRWPTDGMPYSRLRVPEQETDMIGTYPFRREQIRNALTALDFVFLTNAQEVDFERTTARSTDVVFRDTIQAELLLLYRDITHNPVFELRGTPQERHNLIKTHLSLLLGTHFVARTALTAFMHGDYTRAESHLLPASTTSSDQPG